MVGFPPVAPSVAWYAAFIRAFANTFDEDKAIQAANARLSSPKEFGRYLFRNTHGDILVQSMAVEGGGRQLRSFDKIAGLRLSDHGLWRKNHLGALQALLGKKPFYRHIERALHDVYSNSELDTLKEFNMAIFRLINSFLMENIEVTELSQYAEVPVVKARGQEIAEEMGKDVSVLQALMSYGKETLLGLLAFDND